MPAQNTGTRYPEQLVRIGRQAIMIDDFSKEQEKCLLGLGLATKSRPHTEVVQCMDLSFIVSPCVIHQLLPYYRYIYIPVANTVPGSILLVPLYTVLHSIETNHNKVTISQI